MLHDRVFQVADHLQPNPGEPIRSVVHATDEAAIVAWTVKPGQRISPHVHPGGQDTWTVLAGEGDYQIDASGATVRIAAGDGGGTHWFGARRAQHWGSGARLCLGHQSYPFRLQTGLSMLRGRWGAAPIARFPT